MSILRSENLSFATQQKDDYRFICIIEITNVNEACDILQRATKPALQALYTVYATQIRRSVYLCLRPSHSGIVSKLANAEGCGLLYRVAHCL